MRRLLVIGFMCFGLLIGGCSQTASPISAVADNNSIPVPTILDVSYLSSSATIEWSISNTDEIAYFELYIKSPKSQTYSAAIIISANVTSYTDSEIFSEGVGEYLFVLSAVNVKNEQGRSSNIYRYNFQGYKVSLKTLSTFGGTTLKGPEGIVVTSAKRVFISDTNNHRILEVSETGALINTFGSRGSGTGQFWSPLGLAVDSQGRILVADANNDRVVRFDPDNFNSTFVTFSKIQGGSPVSGTGLGEFNFPVSCAVGPDGEIYVADLNNNRVQKIVLANNTNFTGASATLFDIGSVSPRDILATASRLYILDNNGYLMVKRFNTESDFTIDLITHAVENGLSSSISFRGIAIDETSQEIFVSSDSLDKIMVFSMSGNFRASFGSSGTGLGSFSAPAGMCFSDSKLYVIEKDNKRLQIFQ